MEFVQSMFWWVIGSALPFLFVLTVVVFFHELGHFLVARWNGIGVAKFAVGFGPDICGFTDKHGTRWALSAIPLGGYVKFIDDANVASMPGETSSLEAAGYDKSLFFAGKKLWQRAAVVAAGPIANFILAIVIFSAILFFVGRTVQTARVDSIRPDSVAAQSEFLVGDTVVAINGGAIESFADLRRIVAVSAETPLKVTVLRDGAEVNFLVTPALTEVEDGLGGTHRVGQLGILRNNNQEELIHQSFNPIEAVVEGTKQTGQTVLQLVQFLGKLVIGRESVDQLGGPLSIADLSARVAAVGFIQLIHLTAFLSISIGFMNLLPIPVLDGGHLMFYAIEGIRGKPLSDRVQQVGYKIGLAMVLTLMIFVTTLDIGRFLD